MRSGFAFPATRFLLTLALIAATGQRTLAAEPDPKQLERQFPSEIQPLVQKYCSDCHSAELAEAEINLTLFSSWSEVRKWPEVWQKAGHMLDSRQMPPKDAPQPSDAERSKLQTWVRSYLTYEAQARAGDPGQVVLRRLSNAEYTYTVRDLTGIPSLDPAREFPVDGAAGEGFTNTGNALVMSPALVTKYLDAAKDIARHAVLLPDGFKFSPHTTSRDWTNDVLAEIRAFYGKYTESKGGDKVNLQGIIFDTNEGGRLPLERYLNATVVEREAIASGNKSLATAAKEHGLNPKYLSILWQSLNSTEPSLLLDELRARWRSAKPADVPALVDHVAAWQKGLWRFTTVGHIGKLNGPKKWQESVNPLVAKQELRFKVPPASGDSITLSLVTSDAGDGHEHDYVVWQQPRFVAPGRPDLLLRDVRQVTRQLTDRRARIFASTSRLLAAAHEVASSQEQTKLTEIAAKHSVDASDLVAWLDFLGIGSGATVELTGHFTSQIKNASGYDFIQGWGSHNTPLLLANSSDEHVRVPGNMRPHSVAVHPSPQLKAVVGWKSPVSGTFDISAHVAHAHPECGNGVTWAIELRRGRTRQQLASGIAHGGTPAVVPPIKNLSIRTGDLISLAIGPRDNNHSCDLTAVDLTLAQSKGSNWNLASDVSGNVLAGNPHADQLGNSAVWHFYTEPNTSNQSRPVIPAGSLLARWQAAERLEEKQQLANDLQEMLVSRKFAKDSPDSILYKQLASLSGPLLELVRSSPKPAPASTDKSHEDRGLAEVGLDPNLFGQHPNGGPLDPASLCVQAPSVIDFQIQAELVEGYELVTTAVLDPTLGREGSVQLFISPGAPSNVTGLSPSEVKVTVKSGQWTGNNRNVSYNTAILVNEASKSRKRFEEALEEFRQLFPPALCYTKIVPVDEVVTLTLFYREDEHLARLMLEPAEKEQLDRLWDELHFVSHDALTLVDAYAQLMEYATQDADPKVFEPLRKPIEERAAAFRQKLIDSEPKQLEALIRFASQAFRRPLDPGEPEALRELYASLRRQELSHNDAFRLTLARILVSPAFLYRIEKPVPGSSQGPVTNWELSNRLSYFLWSSAPDQELREAAASGQLQELSTLRQQTRRMLRDEKVRRLAVEFSCQWLLIRNFDQLDEKSERHFPQFNDLRDEMYEESVQFFTKLFQEDGSVLDILDSNYTYLNEELAKHYGIPDVTGPEWRRVDGVRRFNRGGVLAQATVLASQSGASRTSPILRGNWISEVLLGERLPRPPKGVPPLPDDEAGTEGLTVRQLVEKHSSDPKCAVCHVRIDPFGFALEHYDAIGRHREKDLGDRAIDTKVKTMDGAELDGMPGLRNYLLTVQRDAFLRQFSRKLLGYALGRAVQLSDEPLLAEIQTNLKANDYRISIAIETIVASRQFREIRGIDVAYEEH